MEHGPELLYDLDWDGFSVAKQYAETRNVQAGCAIERTTFKLHVRPKGAATWSKKI